MGSNQAFGVVLPHHHSLPAGSSWRCALSVVGLVTGALTCERRAFRQPRIRRGRGEWIAALILIALPERPVRWLCPLRTPIPWLPSHLRHQERGSIWRADFFPFRAAAHAATPALRKTRRRDHAGCELAGRMLEARTNSWKPEGAARISEGHVKRLGGSVDDRRSPTFEERRRRGTPPVSMLFSAQAPCSAVIGRPC
jgi:hypothetical protein